MSATPSRRILVTGGAGFVGASLTIALAERSAEPSVLAGSGGTADYPLLANFLGAYHCLRLCRGDRAALVFVSTSRVYPVAGLAAVAVRTAPTRFELADEQPLPGVPAAGIAEEFPPAGARTPYGTTKLVAKLIVEEYRAAFGLRAVVDRFGGVAGPWQMAKVDQGVFTQVPVTAAGGDVPICSSDCTRLHARTVWRPRRSPRAIHADVAGRVEERERALAEMY